MEKLIAEEDFLRRAREGMRIEIAIPARFANGYFMRGIQGKDELYATIKPEYRDELQQLLDRNKSPRG